VSQGKLQSLGQPNFSQGISQQGMSPQPTQADLNPTTNNFGVLTTQNQTQPQNTTLNSTMLQNYNNLPQSGQSNSITTAFGNTPTQTPVPTSTNFGPVAPTPIQDPNSLPMQYAGEGSPWMSGQGPTPVSIMTAFGTNNNAAQTPGSIT